ncbi:MAG: hypothetical protein JO212_04520 [Acetobacteraceae bacterium]|nr:hypothetical protein [Acetobacteraceae bacterium]
MTEKGREVVRRYRAIEARAREAGATELDALLGSLAPERSSLPKPGI